MCARYVIRDEYDEEELRRIIEEANRNSRESVRTGEIFPSHRVPVLTAPETAVSAVWGLPGFRGKSLIINTRSETAGSKPMFRDNFENRRCAVPASGFFEWDRAKRKYVFTLPSGGLMYLAGIYGFYGGERRFSILTMPAVGTVSEIHDRMPVIVPAKDVPAWLNDAGAALSVIRSAAALKRQLVR